MATNTTYATISELKPLVGIKLADTASDAILQRVLNSAARQFDMKTRRPPEGREAFSESASETRYFDDAYTARYVAIDDLLTVSAVVRGTDTITSDYYYLDPRGTPHTRFYFQPNSYPGYSYPYLGIGLGQIAITGTWGYCTAANRPDQVGNAVLNLAAIMYKLQAVNLDQVLQMVSNQSPYGIMAATVKDAIQTFRKVSYSVV